ncbi:MAG: NAD(P)/FAD-dependent oxidoreductase, partial [Gammaproteobacteria bacterium]
MSAAPYIVVGGGQAGLQVCDSLRKLGYAGELLLVAAEPVLPYQRPPLSKKYLGGELAAERLLFRPAAHYEKLAVDVRLAVTVTAIDRARREIECSDGTRLAYARLALATGTRVRQLQCPGAELDAVLYVRTLADSDALRARLTDAARVVVIGGGFIGLEVAAMARQLGKGVVVLEALDRLMARAVSPAVSDFYATLHGGHGVDVRLKTGVAAIETAAHGVSVVTSDGERLPADVVVAGIGVVANEEVAAAAGLECR